MTKQISKKYELFEHQADMGVRGYGANAKEAFEQAAYALTSIVCDVNDLKALNPININCHAPELKLLFVDWLNCLIYEIETNKVIFSDFEITELNEMHLKAIAWSEPINREKHHPIVGLKGATYTCLKVEEIEPDLWVAQCVIDV